MFNDRYFVHQRGLRLAAWILAIAVSSSISGVVGGLIIESLGWPTAFKTCKIPAERTLLKSGSVALGVSTLLLFFFCPETAYQRPASSNIDLTGVISPPSPPPEYLDEKLPEIQEEAWTLRQELRPWRGIESDDNLLQIIWRPIPLSILPPVLFSFVVGLSWAWLSVLFGVTALIYGSQPYNFTVSQIGLLYIGAMVVSILAFVSGPLNDWACKFLARRNRGIYEPEVTSQQLPSANISFDS